jgi:uncharacterized membrane protein
MSVDSENFGLHAAKHSGSPTAEPAHPPGLNTVLERNNGALQARRSKEEREATVEERVADAITRFAGSMRFVYLHLFIFGFWLVGNVGLLPVLRPWDPSFVILAMIASVEAIFLSTFVLISQNRMAAAADKRADLDLQISLLAEHELTRLVGIVATMAERQGIPTNTDPEIQEAKRDIAPEAVLDELDAAKQGSEVAPV